MSERDSRLGWVYNLDDYKKLFALSEADFQKSILEFPGYFSSCNAEITALGGKIISLDPLYQLSPAQMAEHIDQLFKFRLSDWRQYLHQRQWLNTWRKNTERFLADYAIGKQQGRYQTPATYSAEKMYDLLLSADYLFKNGNKVDQIMDQLCHMATEVRIFPLPDVEHISSELGPLMLSFQQRNFGVEVRAVSYPQRNDGKAMLRIWAKECKVSL